VPIVDGTSARFVDLRRIRTGGGDDNKRAMMTRSIRLLMSMFAAVAVTHAAAEPPRSAHEHDAAAHAGGAVHPSHRDAAVVQPRGPVTKPCRTVFGFLPYWVSSSGVRWDLLTHVACFDVTVNGSGQITNSRSWPWTATINSARASGVRVLLTVTNFNPSQISTIVGSSTARQTMAVGLANLIRNNADGVVIDFEGVNSPAWQAQMPAFVADLRQRLTVELAGSAYPDPLIFVASPAVNWAGASGWNFAALAQQADGLFIMGYDFYGSWSGTSGPSSPLTGGSFNVTNTVLTQYAAARQQSPHRLILGVPYYGNQWTTSSGAAYSTALSHVGSVTYSSAMTQLATRTRQFDAVSQTPWMAWSNAGTWNQTWFDDEQSLSLKYALARGNNLGGVGMWALGYDAGRTELWSLIDQQFRVPCACRADFDLSGSVSVQDVFDFLAAFFAGDARADVNGVGGLSVQDVFDFLGAYFAGCP
jgi:spore germination protein YaaH